MRTNEDIIKNLNITSVAIMIALNIITNKLQDIFLNGESTHVQLILMFLINAGIYVGIFYTCKFIYYFYWKLRYPECNITGTWYHFHYIQGDNDYLRFGTIKIKQNFFNVSMTGENYSLEQFDTNGVAVPVNKKMTYWHTITGNINQEGQITTCYISERTSGDSDIREGIHHFIISANSIKKHKPTKIIGKFKDSAPCNKHGCIMMYNNIQDRDNAIRYYCQYNENLSNESS